MPKQDDDYWRKKLTPEQYQVLRQKGTEAPFSGKLLYHQEKGTYTCAACATPLFSSDTKYKSSALGLAGWPSFGDVIDRGNVELREDNSWGMNRTEVVCKTCGGHLGHLFADAASPTGQHYCINSCALDFKTK
ncbi:peptide-methionine (R)-S-oxide reductase MsrB [Candidatus Microgenomates bacterium]|nr:peptide-methionine (R)-S-oxide reductase MsrB [Candidatus Microgenomates bacterium]